MEMRVLRGCLISLVFSLGVIGMVSAASSTGAGSEVATTNNQMVVPVTLKKSDPMPVARTKNAFLERLVGLFSFSHQVFLYVSKALSFFHLYLKMQSYRIVDHNKNVFKQTVSNFYILPTTVHNALIVMTHYFAAKILHMAVSVHMYIQLFVHYVIINGLLALLKRAVLMKILNILTPVYLYSRQRSQQLVLYNENVFWQTASNFYLLPTNFHNKIVLMKNRVTANIMRIAVPLQRSLQLFLQRLVVIIARILWRLAETAVPWLQKGENNLRRRFHAWLDYKRPLETPRMPPEQESVHAPRQVVSERVLPRIPIPPVQVTQTRCPEPVVVQDPPGNFVDTTIQRVEAEWDKFSALLKGRFRSSDRIDNELQEMLVVIKSYARHATSDTMYAVIDGIYRARKAVVDGKFSDLTDALKYIAHPLKKKGKKTLGNSINIVTDKLLEKLRRGKKSLGKKAAQASYWIEAEREAIASAVTKKMRADGFMKNATSKEASLVQG